MFTTIVTAATVSAPVTTTFTDLIRQAIGTSIPSSVNKDVYPNLHYIDYSSDE
jgi:hypothetical protein